MEKYRQFSLKKIMSLSQTFIANLKKINAHRLSAGEEANEKPLYGLKHIIIRIRNISHSIFNWFKF